MAKNKKQEKNSQAPLIKFSDDFWIMLDKIAQVDNSEIAWSLYELDSNPIVKNIMRVSNVDLSEKEGRFSLTISGSKVDVRITSFIKNYFGDQFSEAKIEKFVKSYNKIVGGFGEDEEDEDYEKVEVEDFKYDPTDIKSTFISLVTETYPYGHEEEVLKYLPSFLKKDQHGNYYHLIGKNFRALL